MSNKNKTHIIVVIKNKRCLLDISCFLRKVYRKLDNKFNSKLIIPKYL